MTKPRLPGNDPRTLARDIPGLFEALFPHLVPGVVAYLNQQSSTPPGCARVRHDAIRATTLARAMLFELAVAVAEQRLAGEALPNWEDGLSVAVKRQRRHFDAWEPAGLDESDKTVALQVAENLLLMMSLAKSSTEQPQLVLAPKVPGYQWIASGVGDFALGTHLIEVKCTNRHFSSADYRQVLIYWLLSYAEAIERNGSEWTHIILMNPRQGHMLTLPFDELVRLLAAGRTKVELLELFATIVGERKA